MNKSVLIVICDFLLLSLLSLANFDNIQTEDAAAKEEAKEAAIEQSFTDSQMLDLLKMSLDSERDRRQALNTDVEKLSKSAEETRLQAEQQKKIIEARESELKQMALTKAQLENERAQILEKSKALESRVATTEERNIALQKEIVAASTSLEKAAQERIELERKLGDMRQMDSASKMKLEAIQNELKQNKEHLEKLKSESEALKNENKAIEIEKRALATQLEVATTKTQIYEENLKRAEALVTIEKNEKEKIREHAETLAVGVSELASSQEKLAKNVQDLRPQTPSEIFEGIKESFVRVVFNYTRNGLLGNSESSIEIRAIPIKIDGKVWLIFGSGDTVIAPTPNAYYAPQTLSVSVLGKAYRFSPRTVSALNEDPRLLAIPVPDEFIEKEKLTPLITAQKFFNFNECVVVNPAKFYYGQVPFRADFKNNAYAQLDVGLLQSVFGTFSPSEGDLVLSRSGNYLGCRANGVLAILMRKFSPSNSLNVGKKYTPQEAAKFVGELSARLKSLPLSLK